MGIPSLTPSGDTVGVQRKTPNGVVLAVIACVMVLALTFIGAAGIAMGGYSLARAEKARAQREATEADRAVAAAFQETLIAINDAKAELLDARAEGDRMFDQANEILDDVEAVMESGKVDAAELRSWSRGAFTLEARFVRLDGENVILRKADGVDVSVPLEELSPVDQCVAAMSASATETVSSP